MNVEIAKKMGIKAKDLNIFSEDRYGRTNTDWIIWDRKTDRVIGKGSLFACAQFKSALSD